MLYNWLVGYSEGTTRSKAPVCGVETYRGLVKTFAGAAEREEALRIQIRKDEDEYVEGEVDDRAKLVRHCFAVSVRRCRPRDRSTLCQE